MDASTFSDYLTERYEDQIDWYNAKAADNQNKYWWIQWTIIVLAAATPVLIQFQSVEWAHHLATVTSAAVVILTAGLKTFKYQENWINYRTTCENLRKEKHFFAAQLGEYGAARDKQALFINRVESLMARENTMWISAHKPGQQSDGNTEADANDTSSDSRSP